MTNILRKFTVAVTGAVVGFALTGVNSAQAASLNFSLSFFDSTNSLVGEGQSNGKSVNTGYLIVEEIQPCHENSEAVPEPATVAGLGLAAAGLGAAKKKFAASKV